MESNQELAGQVAAITGATGDIGRAIVASLAQAGAKVAYSDLEDMSENDADNAEFPSDRVSYARVDTTKAEEIEHWLEAIAGKWGETNVAIANAATVTPKSLRELSADEWRSELEVNLTGAFLLANTAAKRMAARGIAGKIILVGSWAAERPHPHVPAYGVAKAGLRMLCKLLAAEYAKDGIQSIEIAPGYVDAGLSAQVFRQDPKRAEEARAKVPLRRFIEPQEVGALVRQLCNPSNRHMTGSVITFDGGLSL